MEQNMKLHKLPEALYSTAEIINNQLVFEVIRDFDTVLNEGAFYKLNKIECL
jgi:hypothetical protein